MGSTFDANYTMAKNQADNQGDAPSSFAGEVNYGIPIADRFHVSQDYGNVQGTRRNRMLLTGVYQLPFGAGRPFMTGRRMEGQGAGWLGSDERDVARDRAVADAEYQCGWVPGGFECGWVVSDASKRPAADERPVEYECGEPGCDSAAGCGVDALLCGAVTGAVLQPGGVFRDSSGRGTIWECGSWHSAGTGNGGGQPGRGEELCDYGEGACDGSRRRLRMC